jgi:hypothetical protein
MRNYVRVFAMGLMCALPHAAFAQTVTVPPVPDNLEVPQGNQAFLVGHAFGSQNYVCAPDATLGRVAWALFTPEATLFNEQSEQLITHFNSPNPNPDPTQNGIVRATWESSGDTSRVWAKANATSLDAAFVTAGAIPWVLLEVVGNAAGPTGGNSLGATTFIHRLNTAGGAAPSTDCDNPQDLGRKAFVPYKADYFFYKKN